MPWARGQSRVVHARDLIVSFEPLCDGQSVLTVSLHPQAERLDALDESKGVVRGDRRTHVAKQLDACLDDVSNRVTQNTGVARTVVAGVGLGEPGELVDVL